ncbi:MAG: VanZ family protein [Gammaproteobacteria bacterium]|jgi:VanZ family protein|nr:VanZ family protein [Gammaproteobacteria bacterium]
MRRSPSFRWPFRGLLAAALTAITWLALTPSPPVGVEVSDKVQHAAAFLALALLADLSWPDADYWLPKALPLLAYGALIELAQAGTATRTAEWPDLAADAAGLALYPLIARALRAIPGLRRWWAG